MNNTCNHTYLGCSYTTEVVGLETYAVKLAGVLVTGTTSKSRGEAAMRFNLMLDEMQDFESKPVSIGDLLEVDGKVFGIITSLELIAENKVKFISIREGRGDAETNFRGATFASKHDQDLILTIEGDYTYRPKTNYEWNGVVDIEFRAYSNDGPETFKYTKTVNVWKEAE